MESFSNIFWLADSVCEAANISSSRRGHLSSKVRITPSWMCSLWLIAVAWSQSVNNAVWCCVAAMLLPVFLKYLCSVNQETADAIKTISAISSCTRIAASLLSTAKCHGSLRPFLLISCIVVVNFSWWACGPSTIWQKKRSLCVSRQVTRCYWLQLRAVPSHLTGTIQMVHRVVIRCGMGQRLLQVSKE